MLIKAKALKGFALRGTDGEIGKVEEFYFDDRHWTIRYLVADTGNWLKNREVLISPYALRDVDKEKRDIAIDLKMKQIERSPSLETDKPVSRQFEAEYSAYYGWPLYWGGPYMWGAYSYVEHDREKWKEVDPGGKEWDAHLRSTNAVTGHIIQATDGEIGHVEDFIIDDQSWAIRYLVINTRNWWPGKKVLISPKWIERVSWNEMKVFIMLKREAIKESPEYTEESLLTRDDESRLHHHYKHEGYWVDDPAVKASSH